MQATLIYNPNAGSISSATVEDLQDGLRDVGYEPVYKATTCIEDLNPILAEVKGLVVTAGGDGTARAAILRLIGREDICFTPLPMGSANNMCRSLGIAGNPLDIIQRLSAPQETTLDLGHLQAPWGEDYFIEGAGIGFFAEVLATYDPTKGKSILRSLQSLLDVFQQGFVRKTSITLAEKRFEGEFLAIEALNTTAVGPRLKFAPEANPHDGLLDVVCIRADQKESYFNYLNGLLREELYVLDSVETYRVPEVTLSWHGFPVHVDAEVHPPNYAYLQAVQNGEKKPVLNPFPNLPANASIRIRAIPQALRIWLPKSESK